MAEQEQNRSEAATPHKIEEAKKRGNVAKSLEVGSLMAVLAFLTVLYAWGWPMAQKQLLLSQGLLAHAHQVNFELSHFMNWLNGAILGSVYLLVPLFILIAVVGILTSVVQTGPVFTFFPLKPDFERINPVAGFKRVFSLRMLLEALKSVVKLGLFGAVLYFALKGIILELMQMMQASPAAYGPAIIGHASAIIFKLACVIALIALIDSMYTRWDYANKLKMSRREVKEEVKRREGDPRVRARIRELQRETLKRSKAAGRIKDADVVITNPVHLAVALRYERSEMQAPKVLAKGAGELAAQMKEVARRHCVPVVENRKLARALFRQVDFDAYVPEKLYPEVARILVWVYAMRERKAWQGAAA